MVVVVWDVLGLVVRATVVDVVGWELGATCVGRGVLVVGSAGCVMALVV